MEAGAAAIPEHTTATNQIPRYASCRLIRLAEEVIPNSQTRPNFSERTISNAFPLRITGSQACEGLAIYDR
jgi:hypothetical protein